MKTKHLTLTGAVSYIWKAYKEYVHQMAFCHRYDENYEGMYWKDKLFANILTYGLPLAILALIPSILIELKNGNHLTAVADLIAYLAVTVITLNPNISLKFKKSLGLGIFFAFALVKMVTLGSSIIGGIYLLAFSLFTTFLFSNRTAYCSIVVNALVCAIIATLIGLKINFDNLAIFNYSLAGWSISSLNLIFLNIVLVFLMHSFIKSLENSLSETASFYSQLQVALKRKNEKKKLLEESEIQYRSLFVKNPLPMWIYNPKTLRFMQVNHAAKQRYGYTKDEFSEMLITQILNIDGPEDSVITQFNQSNELIQRQFPRHQPPFIAEIHSSDIVYKGVNARLCIVRDVTEDINRTDAIEHQNQQLRDIAYLQSHVIRAPLANIMGLVQLLLDEGHLDQELLDYLRASTGELDLVIKDIVTHTRPIEK